MLGQNFARAADIEFLDRDNERKHPYGTSWGFSTRMVGATIMAHGDDSGLVLPPNVAPTQLVIVPIFRTEEDRVAVAERDRDGSSGRSPTSRPRSGPLRWKIDWREESPGFKFNHWELRGVPLRLEIGPRDVAAGQGVLVRRLDREKETLPLDALAAELPGRLADYQADAVPARARLPRREHPPRRHAATTFEAILDGEGGFLMAPLVRVGRVREAGQRGHRCDHPGHPVRLARRAGACVVDGQPSERRVLFARAY